MFYRQNGHLEEKRQNDYCYKNAHGHKRTRTLRDSFISQHAQTWPKCRESSEELTQQQLFRENLLQILLTLHRETLTKAQVTLELVCFFKCFWIL